MFHLPLLLHKEYSVYYFPVGGDLFAIDGSRNIKLWNQEGVAEVDSDGGVGEFEFFDLHKLLPTFKLFCTLIITYKIKLVNDFNGTF